ncbi:MAG: ABC transporter permease subunit [Erysipelotrichaceae bacterium]|nr:ABC transporter permease subunit [Erysipelotrichaceae bacterium]
MKKAVNDERASIKRRKKLDFLKNQLVWWGMLLPGLLITIIFKYGSMFGVVIAFEDFNYAAGGFFGHEWVGLDNFIYVFSLKDFSNSIVNTLIMQAWKIVLGIVVPLILALLINEVGKKWFAKFVQTTFFLPFFLSWIILGGIINQVFSYNGIINAIGSLFGAEKALFLIDNRYFRTIMIITDVWKGMGYNMVIFLAAIIGIDPSLYEAAEVDGASRIRRVIHITLPGIAPMVVLLSTLALGGLLNGNFDQIYILYNPLVYETGDIIDTFIYRISFFGNMQMDVGAAVGLMKSLISIALIGGTYFFAYKKFGYRIF